METNHLKGFLRCLRTALLSQEASGVTDTQLLESFIAQKDEAAFAALVRRHGPMVWGVCRRVLGHVQDAEDAFQATFLVLVRKAASVVPRGMVGNWLHGVAYRTALKARAASTKRRRKEKQVEALPEPQAAAPDHQHDLLPLLDQELDRLPDKYRLAVILCDLEGKTHKEAARQLGWPVGTLSTRLLRARAKLAKRLTRRGVTLSAGSLAVVVSQNAGSVCVPPSLMDSTVKAATLFAAGQVVTTGLISSEVAALTEGVLTAMFLSKVKVFMTMLVTAVIFVTGTGVMMSQGSSLNNPEKKSQATSPDEPARDSPERKTASSAQTPKEFDRVTASAEEIGNAYQTNMALADEKFTGKRVAVTGKMWRITRGGYASGGLIREGQALRAKSPKPLYNLEMSYSVGTGIRLLQFQFTADDRKQLATLKAGQQVTIEGAPNLEVTHEGETGLLSPDRRTIRFVNCKILSPKVD